MQLNNVFTSSVLAALAFLLSVLARPATDHSAHTPITTLFHYPTHRFLTLPVDFPPRRRVTGSTSDRNPWMGELHGSRATVVSHPQYNRYFLCSKKLQENEEGTYAAVANRISGINMVQKKQGFIFKRPGSDSLGEGCPRSDGECCSNKKGRCGNTAVKSTIVCTLHQARAPSFAAKFFFEYRTCRGPIPGLSASHFAPDCANAEESTSGLNFSLVRFHLLKDWILQPLLSVLCLTITGTQAKKKSWKSPEIRNKFNLSGQKKVVGVLGWNGNFTRWWTPTNRPA